MNTLSIDFKRVPPELTVDRIIEAISASLPGTRVTWNDWFEKREKEERARVAMLRKAGSRISDETIETVARAKERNGETKEIFIPDAATGMIGPVSLRSILVKSDHPIGAETAAAIWRAVNSLSIEAVLRIF